MIHRVGKRCGELIRVIGPCGRADRGLPDGVIELIETRASPVIGGILLQKEHLNAG